MKFHRNSRSPLLLFVLLLVFLSPGAIPTESICLNETPAVHSTPPGMKDVVSLWDFTRDEVKGAGFVLSRDAEVHVSALGGGDRMLWRDMFEDRDDSRMYAAGWIINADTREKVWEMTMDNTSGSSDKRSFDGTVDLKQGSYEVYFSAHGYYYSSTFSNSSMNIDRRPDHRPRNWSGNALVRIFGGSTDRESYDDFMERARDYGITVSVDDAEAGTVRTFEAPRKPANVVFQRIGLGDGEFVKQSLTLSRPLTLHIYALGEGRRHDDIYDHGWIVDSRTRKRVWNMADRNVQYAGGASKNIRWDGDISLDRGTYELYYVTDDSHSSEDWNAKPPYDPFNYGVTISAKSASDRNAVTVGDVAEPEKNVIVNLTKVGDDDYVTAGFRLKANTTVRVYAIGERDDDEMADYGWIQNAKTRERVWTMDSRDTYHAGGDSKNRMVDEVLTLPKGEYVAYYQTDGSHSYDRWNSDPPYDERHYGLTVMGWGDDYDPGNVAPFTEGDEENVIAQLIRVRDRRHMSKEFTLDKSTRVEVYALGEGVDDEMVDYGWIEDAKTGRTIWEMTYRMTDRAGGARKNRMVRTSLTLDKGTYELHYRTDGSHAFNDWNDTPPEDRIHWGITIYKE